jgi:preprotein translocase subunit YajC
MPDEMIFGEFGAPLYLGDIITTNEGAIMGKLVAIDGETVEIDLGEGVIMRVPAVECSPFDQS